MAEGCCRRESIGYVAPNENRNSVAELNMAARASVHWCPKCRAWTIANPVKLDLSMREATFRRAVLTARDAAEARACGVCGTRHQSDPRGRHSAGFDAKALVRA